MPRVAWLGGAHLDQGRAQPVLVILRGLHVGPALVLAPRSLWGLRLLPRLHCRLRLPVLQSDPLGLGLSVVSAIRVSCLTVLAKLLPPFGFQEPVKVFLGGEVSASRQGRKRTLPIRRKDRWALRIAAPARMLIRELAPLNQPPCNQRENAAACASMYARTGIAVSCATELLRTKLLRQGSATRRPASLGAGVPGVRPHAHPGGAYFSPTCTVLREMCERILPGMHSLDPDKVKTNKQKKRQTSKSQNALQRGLSRHTFQQPFSVSRP